MRSAASVGLVSCPWLCKPRNAARSGNASASAPRSCSCMSVSMTPGASEQTLAPLGCSASSRARQRVKWSMPALAAQYADDEAMARRPRPEDMLSTLRGICQCCVAPRKAAHSCIGASKPTRKAWARSPGLASRKGTRSEMTPALLISVALAMLDGSWARSQSPNRAATGAPSARSMGHCSSMALA